MRQLISGFVAAAAVVTVSAAPALACGGGGLFQGSCSPCGGYVSPCGGYAASGYGYAGGYAGVSVYQMLPRPTAQYYYVNQGPVFSGPASFAPYPVYQDRYGYDGGPYGSPLTHYSDAQPYYRGPAIYSYRARPAYRSWRPRPVYSSGYFRHSYRYAVRPQVGYGYGPRVNHGHRFGYGVPHHQYQRPLRRLY